ncbi:MFS transporter, partial [Burkholderia pseudomallei]
MRLRTAAREPPACVTCRVHPTLDSNKGATAAERARQATRARADAVPPQPEPRMSDTRLSASAAAPRAANTTNHRRIVFASFIGTAIEFYDFYVYATAAALVIGPVFFPHGSATAQALSAFVTFGIAFIARPIGSFLFGHFGDRIGRKSTLVASLLVMGVSTTAIGFVPGYDAIGALAPVLLCVLRFGQGI